MESYMKLKKTTTTKSTHPGFKEMVIQAIKSHNEKKGSSRQAIKKYIETNYDVKKHGFNSNLSMCLKKMIESEFLFHPESAPASFKINKAELEKIQKEAKAKEKLRLKKEEEKKKLDKKKENKAKVNPKNKKAENTSRNSKEIKTKQSKVAKKAEKINKTKTNKATKKTPKKPTVKKSVKMPVSKKITMK